MYHYTKYTHCEPAHTTGTDNPISSNTQQRGEAYLLNLRVRLAHGLAACLPYMPEVGFAPRVEKRVPVVRVGMSVPTTSDAWG